VYCGIDIGTSSIKCLLVDETGVRMGLGRAPVGLYRQDGRYEADPLEWLKATATAFSEAAEATGLGVSGLRSRLRAVSVSGNGPTLVAVGRDGLPVGRASSWMDRDAAVEAKAVSEVAGRSVDPSFYLPKALRAVNSDAEGRIAMFFSGPEYLAFTLGAGPVSYLADDFYDAYVWDRKTAAGLGLDAALFPPYAAPAERIGSVSIHASEAIGLPAGLPIISGFPDFLAALVGSGTVAPALACDRSGSSEALNVCATKPYPDRSVFSLPHAVSGLWNLSGGLSTSGKALEWFSSVAGYSGIGSDSVYQDAERVAAGADGVLFLPYLTGERAPLWNAALRGAFVGLSLSHGRREMARAVVESIAFGLRLAADRIREGGFPIDSARCSGGAARDDALCSIKADVLGIAVEVPQTPECEAMGDACACAVALRDHGSLSEASQAMVRVGSRFEPDPARKALYDERYAAWRAALDAAVKLAGPAS
jgi:xylulokinase